MMMLLIQSNIVFDAARVSEPTSFNEAKPGLVTTYVVEMIDEARSDGHASMVGAQHAKHGKACGAV